MKLLYLFIFLLVCNFALAETLDVAYNDPTTPHVEILEPTAEGTTNTTNNYYYNYTTNMSYVVDNFNVTHKLISANATIRDANFTTAMFNPGECTGYGCGNAMFRNVYGLMSIGSNSYDSNLGQSNDFMIDVRQGIIVPFWFLGGFGQTWIFGQYHNSTAINNVEIRNGYMCVGSYFNDPMFGMIDYCGEKVPSEDITNTNGTLFVQKNTYTGSLNVSTDGNISNLNVNNLTIKNNKVCNITACFSLQELNNSGSMQYQVDNFNVTNLLTTKNQSMNGSLSIQQNCEEAGFTCTSNGIDFKTVYDDGVTINDRYTYGCDYRYMWDEKTGRGFCGLYDRIIDDYKYYWNGTAFLTNTIQTNYLETNYFIAHNFATFQGYIDVIDFNNYQERISIQGTNTGNQRIQAWNDSSKKYVENLTLDASIVFIDNATIRNLKSTTINNSNNAYIYGNITGNNYYGEMKNWSISGYTATPSAQSVYENITNLYGSNLNGFKIINDANSAGGTKLQAQYSGIYDVYGKITWTIGNGATDGFGIVNNSVNPENTGDCYSQQDGIGSRNSMSVGCIYRLKAGDNLTAVYDDQTNPVKTVTIYKIEVKARWLGN